MVSAFGRGWRPVSMMLGRCACMYSSPGCITLCGLGRGREVDVKSTQNGSHNRLLNKTAPPVPTERPAGVPEHARPALIRSLYRDGRQVLRWVWLWTVE